LATRREGAHETEADPKSFSEQKFDTNPLDARIDLVPTDSIAKLPHVNAS